MGPPLLSFEQTNYHTGYHRIQSLYTQHLQHFNTPTPTQPQFIFNTVNMRFTAAVAPYPSANGTTTAPYGTGVPAGTGSSATGSSTAPAYTGAANQAYLSASAGFLALFGLVAAF